MTKYYCPDCGKIMDESVLPEACPNCGCPSTAFEAREVSTKTSQTSEEDSERNDLINNVSPALEATNNFGPEHTINGLASAVLGIGIILGVIGVMMGIYFFTNHYGLDDTVGVIFLAVGIIVFLACLLFWAVAKLLVNISYRLTRLDNKYNPK